MPMSYVRKTKEDFFEHIDNKDIKTINAYRIRIKDFEKYCLGKFGKEDVLDQFPDKQDQVDLFQKWVNFNSKKRAPSAVWNFAASLRKYTYYRGWQLARGDLSDLIELPAKPEKELYGLQLSDMHKIFAELQFNDKLLHCFDAVSGTRIGESVQLRKKHFLTDYERIVVKIPSHIAKFKRARTSFVTKEVGSMLKSRLKKLDEDDLVFGTKNFGVKDDRQVIANAVHTSSSVKEDNLRRKLDKIGLDTRHEDTGRYWINTHSFRAWFITKVSRYDPNLAKLFAGEKGYLLQYDRLSVEEKLEHYIEFESSLYIFDQTMNEEKIRKLKEANLKYAEQEAMIKEQDIRLKSLERSWLTSNMRPVPGE